MGFLRETPWSWRESERGLLRSALRSSAGKVFWDLLGRALSFVVSVLIARGLGAAGYGRYAVVWYVAWMAAQVTDLGLHLVAVRNVSQETTPGSSRALGAAIHAKGILTLLSVPLYIVASLAIGASAEEIGTAIVFYAAALAGSWAELFGAALRGRGRLALEGVVQGALRAGWLTGAVVALRWGGGVGEIGLALSLGSVPGLLLALFLAHRHVPAEFGSNPNGAWLDLVKQTGPLALTSLATLLYLRADVLLLAFFKGEEAAGLFGASFRLFEALFLFSGGIVAGAFPLMAAKVSGPGLSGVGGLVLRFLLWAAIPAAAGFAVLAEPIVGLLYGQDFAGSVASLRLLGAAVVAVYINALSTHLLVATRRATALVGVVLTRLGVGLALDLVLIPSMGPLGAALAVVGAEWSLALASLAAVRNLLPARIVLREVVLPLSAALIMSATLRVGPQPLALRTALGAATYVGTLFVLWRLAGLLREGPVSHRLTWGSERVGE